MRTKSSAFWLRVLKSPSVLRQGHLYSSYQETLYRSESCKRRLRRINLLGPPGMATQSRPAYRKRCLCSSIACRSAWQLSAAPSLTVQSLFWGGLAQWLASQTTDQGVTGSRPGRGTVCFGFEQVTFTHCLELSLVKPRKPWTDDWLGLTDEAGDYVVHNVLRPRDLVSGHDNMDETVLSSSS